MTINELKRVLAKEKVYKYDYAFSKAEGGFIDVVFYLLNNNNRFQFRIEEREKLIESKKFIRESDACNYFLTQMSTDYPQLKKYIVE